MIKMPYEEIVARIREEAGLSDEQITIRIKQKMDQLSGLISKEGAAHIIANELGITLIEKTSGRLQVKNILAGMRDVEVVGKVVAVYEVRTFQKKDGEGKVGSFVIGDETGTIRVVCWGGKADEIGKISQGDIVRISSAYAKDNQGRLELHLNDKSNIEVNPPGESVSDVAPRKADSSRKKIAGLSDNDRNVELLGTIVQAFDIKFFEIDPATGKKPVGVIDNPDYSYVMNVILDDGSDTIRVAFFRNAVEKLLGKQKEELLMYKEAMASFDEVKHDLLGRIIKVTGNARKNEMMSRLEFVANDVDPNPDPEEELKMLSPSGEGSSTVEDVEEAADSSDLTAEEIEKALRD